MNNSQSFKNFSGRAGKPTKAELELIKATATGLSAECDAFTRPQQLVSSELIALLATDKFVHPDFPDWNLHENGLHLESASLKGLLDLEGKSVRSNLRLIKCKIPEGFDLDGATVDGDFNLQDTIITGTSYLCDAKVKGQVFLHRATINGDESTEQEDENEGISESEALVAYGLEAHGIVLNEAQINGHLDLLNADLSGQFNALGVKISNPAGIALSIQNIIATAVSLDEAELKGSLLIQEARLEGQFSAFGAAFTGSNDLAIEASGARVDAWNMNYASVTGELTMIGVDISGQLQANGVTIENSAGDAIRADYARIGSGIFFKPMKGPEGRRVATVKGCINLSFAVIDKIIDFSEAIISANEHVTLGLRGAIINGEVVLRKAVFEGHILADAIRMEGRFSFKGTKLSSSPTSGLSQSKTEKNNRDLRKQFKDHALVLREAVISGRLVLPDIRPSGIVDLSRARCDILEDYEEGWPPELPPHVGIDQEDGGDKPDEHTVLDGFEYNYLENPSGGKGYGEDIWKKRVMWLSSQSPQDLNIHFNPQPWRHAADVLRRMGYEDAAQKVTIKGRVRQRRAEDTSFIQRLVSRILHYTASYGFNPWKTVLIAAALMVLFAGIFSFGHRACEPDSYVAGLIDATCSNGDLFAKPGYGDFNEASVEDEYPTFSPLFYSIDVFIPLLDFGEERYWLPNSSVELVLGSEAVLPFWSIPIGAINYVLIFIERIIGAILMAIAITGFTGLLARNES